MTPQERKARGPVMGRPKLPEAQKLRSYSIRLNAAERDKLRRIGGNKAIRDWLSKR